MSRAVDLTGQVFGRLTVIGREGTYVYRSGKRRALWRCNCSCGASTTLSTNTLRTGRTRSCGCLGDETRRTMHRTHGGCATRSGETGAPEYKPWLGMVRRCRRVDDPRYKDHGGRGITVCDRWRESFAAFLADMGPRPPGTTIERKSNDGNYEPGNCCWATMREQNRNTRQNRIIEHQGEALCLTDWAARIGANEATLRGRLDRGWSPERAITTPPDVSRRRHPRAA